MDHYSNWLSVLRLAKDDTQHVIKALREYFSTFGVCESISTDGATVFTSDQMTQFCLRWGIRQRISSAYNAQSNKRAEIGVKSAKRMIMDNVGHSGNLNTDAFARSLLAHRNTPDPDIKVSPAEIVYGRPIRDHIPKIVYEPREAWSSYAKRREDSFLRRHYLKREPLNAHAKMLKPLKEGQTVYVQNQTGIKPKQWDKSGTIVQVLPHDSYLVKIDGSRNLTQRNRKFLRAFTPFPQTNAVVEESNKEEQLSGMSGVTDMPEVQETVDQPLLAAISQLSLNVKEAVLTPEMPLSFPCTVSSAPTSTISEGGTSTGPV